MKFIVEINNYDNAAMCDYPEQATTEILQTIAKKIENGSVYGPVKDANGNTVGNWEFITED